MTIFLAEDDGMGIGGLPLSIGLAAGPAWCDPPWEPMRTAPKSWVDADGIVQGVYLLVFEPLNPADGYTHADDPAIGMGLGWWEPNENGGKGCWYNGSHPINPTHWMRLPAPPVLVRPGRG